jgi:hypothetical protein
MSEMDTFLSVIREKAKQENPEIIMIHHPPMGKRRYNLGACSPIPNIWKLHLQKGLTDEDKS